jgi:hypothetical protein
MRRISLLLAALSVFGGCSFSLDSAGDMFSAPGKYDYLKCPDITSRTQSALAREKELVGLMQRANQDTAGPVVNAFVYQDELNAVRADILMLHKTADDKRCNTQATTVPEQSGAPR